MREPPGFRDFVGSRTPALLRFAWLLTSDWGRAEDLVQTALAQMWSRWSGISPDARDAYARTTIARAAVTWWRRMSSGERPVAVISEISADEGMADTVAQRVSLMAALDRLPRRQRAVVIMRYYLDLSEADVAEALGCSVGTVKSQAAKGVGRLRADGALRTVQDVGTEK